MDADICTDGNWCYIVLWTVPQLSSLQVDWESLKTRLMSACPSCLMSFYFNQQFNGSAPSTLYILKVFCLDRKGLLHGENKCLSLVWWNAKKIAWCVHSFSTDVTRALCQLELTIQRVKVMTTPDDKVLDLFFITDNMWV